ncbi:MAG TPA: XdhC family protein [Flavobacteriales bacterium]|nr:XdhC family protein [Flavobacteriales bacterium]
MNNPPTFWSAVRDALREGRSGVLLTVVESIGSSPGRAGFKAFVADDGTLHGSIGGGSMEQKLVTLARSLVNGPEHFPFLKRQVHQADIGQDRSGMICSGEQTVAFHLLHAEHLPALMDSMDRMDRGELAMLSLDNTGLAFLPGSAPAGSSRTSADEWSYTEPMDVRPHIAIVGGGHVGLALSRTMYQLGFHVHLLDDREGLNTIEANVFADRRTILDYAHIANALPSDPALFVVLASFGYRTDDIVLRQLIRHRYRYLGMLGSAEKVRTLFAAMQRDGFSAEELARVHAPIGVPINSRTPEEIAISIAAEIIRVKNVG